MATRKKTAATVEPVEPVEAAPEAPQPKVIAGLTPGTLTEAGFVPRGPERWVKCPLYPGLDLEVDFLTSIAYRVTREDYTGSGETPVEQESRKLMAYVKGFHNWAFVDPTDGTPIPEPTQDDWKTWQPIVWAFGPLSDLYFWLTGPGLTAALNQSMGG